MHTTQLKTIIKTILIGLLTLIITTATYASPNGEGIQTYQKNVHLLPTHKQKLVDDITRYRNADNLWDVLRDEFSLPHYEESYAVQSKIEWYMNNQDYLMRVASRAAPYLYYISQQVRKRHLPAELVLLPIVESGYNPFSVSSMGASGLWQLMPETATSLGVKRDWAYDGRRDVIASTRAALNYLAYLQSFFEGNWLLAIAAYNTGEGNVLAAIKRNIRDGKDTDFWSLPVAQETRDYVPSLLALAVIISRPDKYPVYLPPVKNAPYLAQVEVGTQLNLKFAAKIAGIAYQRLQTLNPGYSGSSTSSKGQFKLILPIEKVEQFTENLARSPTTQPPSWLHYRVRSGDTLSSISRKYKSPVANIKKMNHITTNSIKPGTNLLIPNHLRKQTPEEQEDAQFEQQLLASASKSTNTKQKRVQTSPKAVNVFSNARTQTTYEIKPGDTVYMVRSSDTLYSIAKHFQVSVAALEKANQLTPSTLMAGKQIIIPTHQPIVSSISKKSDRNSPNPGDTVYMVRKGDTVEKIAKKFKTTASAIRLTNLIDNDLLIEGDKIIIPAHYSG